MFEPGSDSRHLHAGRHAGSKRISPALIPEQRLDPGFDVVLMLSTRHRWFPCGRLSDPHLTQSRRAFSLTLTTGALDPSRSRWFGACLRRPAPRGLPSSRTHIAWRTIICISWLADAKNIFRRRTNPPARNLWDRPATAVQETGRQSVGFCSAASGTPSTATRPPWSARPSQRCSRGDVRSPGVGPARNDPDDPMLPEATAHLTGTTAEPGVQCLTQWVYMPGTCISRTRHVGAARSHRADASTINFRRGARPDRRRDPRQAETSERQVKPLNLDRRRAYPPPRCAWAQARSGRRRCRASRRGRWLREGSHRRDRFGPGTRRPAVPPSGRPPQSRRSPRLKKPAGALTEAEASGRRSGGSSPIRRRRLTLPVRGGPRAFSCAATSGRVHAKQGRHKSIDTHRDGREIALRRSPVRASVARLMAGVGRRPALSRFRLDISGPRETRSSSTTPPRTHGAAPREPMPRPGSCRCWHPACGSVATNRVGVRS